MVAELEVPKKKHISVEPLLNSRVLDKATFAFKTIDFAHHEVHEGCAYYAWKHATLANGEVAALSIVTPNTTKWAHLIVNIRATAGAEFVITEGGTITPGTVFVPRNHNRNSLTASVVAVTAGQTGATLPTTTGTDIVYREDLSAAGRIQWIRQNGNEIILKQNTGYLFEVTNGVNANVVSMVLEWYEHTDKIAL